MLAIENHIRTAATKKLEHLLLEQDMKIETITLVGKDKTANLDKYGKVVWVDNPKN